MVRLSIKEIMMKVSLIVQTQNHIQFMSCKYSATHQMELEMGNLKAHLTVPLTESLKVSMMEALMVRLKEFLKVNQKVRQKEPLRAHLTDCLLVSR